MKPPLFLMVTLWPRPQNWQQKKKRWVALNVLKMSKDRGQHQLETVGLLLALKVWSFCCFHEKPGMFFVIVCKISSISLFLSEVLYPEKVYLIRSHFGLREILWKL
jgi:hypothetical protein